MSQITRRRFLRHSAYLAAAASTLGACSNGSGKHGGRALIIGSGFAGSVAALRLGQAGIATLVLERGQHWTVRGPDSFPSLFNPDHRSTWFGTTDAMTQSAQIQPYAGMVERVSGDTLDALCGSCVGGGSFVYGGVLLQPRRAVFQSVFPRISYDMMDQIYYPRVLQEIGASPIPDDVLASAPYTAARTFLEDAQNAGFEAVRPAASFDWSIIRQELNGDIPAAATISEYIYGCNSDAKLSTDKNYLQRAFDTGFVELRSLTEVEMISERASGGFIVTYRQISPEGEVLARGEEEADYLFLAAGSLNTSKLLLKSQQAGELSGANDRIGQGWGTNGDQLMLEASKRPVGGPQGGPACISATDFSDPQYPIGYEHSPASVPANIQIQLAMSVPDEFGRVLYSAEQDACTVQWPEDSATGSALARRASFGRLLAQTGGTDISAAGGSPSIWHPLGGAVMGDACDDLGQLYGYQNLFVIDGSLMPGSTAASNPAFTIAANAERILESIIPQLSPA